MGMANLSPSIVGFGHLKESKESKDTSYQPRWCHHDFSMPGSLWSFRQNWYEFYDTVYLSHNFDPQDFIGIVIDYFKSPITH